MGTYICNILCKYMYVRIHIRSQVQRFDFCTRNFRYIPPTDKFTLFVSVSSLNARVKAKTSMAGPFDTLAKIDADIISRKFKRIDNNNKLLAVAELVVVPNIKPYRYINFRARNIFNIDRLTFFSNRATEISYL